MNPAPVGRCPSLSATRPLALDVPTQPSGCRDKACLVSVHRKQNATWRKAIFIYATLTYNSIHICKYHLFPITLLMQSNKRSAFPHKSRPPALIIPPPFLFFVSNRCNPFAQRGATLLPKGVRPFCLKGYDPFAQRGATLLPKGVRPFCLKGCDPFA